jgi:hypothetical protein
MHLKPNSAAELTRRLDKEIIPMLRKQKGFQDEINFITSASRGADWTEAGGQDAFAISLWDRKEDADAYNRGTYPEVAKLLATVVDGTPRVETYEVSNSTFHRIPADVTPSSR